MEEATIMATIKDRLQAVEQQLSEEPRPASNQEAIRAVLTEAWAQQPHQLLMPWASMGYPQFDGSPVEESDLRDGGAVNAVDYWFRLATYEGGPNEEAIRSDFRSLEDRFPETAQALRDAGVRWLLEKRRRR